MRGAGSSQVSWVKDSFESRGILSARSRLFHCIKIRIRKTPETQRFRGFWRRSRDLNPGCDYSHYSLSRGAPSASWVLPQVDGKIQLAERVGFEPTDAFTSPVFKTGAFNRSAISPDNEFTSNSQTQELYYHIEVLFVNIKYENFHRISC